MHPYILRSTCAIVDVRDKHVQGSRSLACERQMFLLAHRR